MDEDITVGELCAVLRMGMLRFHLCAKSLTDEDDEEHEEKSDEKNDVQPRDTCEEDEYLTQTIVILSPDLGEVEADAFLDTEVVFGPFLGDPVDSQLDDT